LIASSRQPRVCILNASCPRTTHQPPEIILAGTTLDLALVGGQERQGVAVADAAALQVSGEDWRKGEEGQGGGLWHGFIGKK
jgi:hypothetical protein